MALDENEKAVVVEVLDCAEDMGRLAKLAANDPKRGRTLIDEMERLQARFVRAMRGLYSLVGREAPPEDGSAAAAKH